MLLLDQEGEQTLGGQAFWSLGGLFLVDSPEQRRMGIKDSHELALQDWLGSAQFDREEDRWPRAWAEAYVDFAAGEKRVLAARDGPPDLPDRRLGRARRRPRGRARQLGAALPHHLGDRPGRRRAVRAAGPRARRRRPASRFGSGTGSTTWSSRAAPSSASGAARCEPDGAERGKASSRVEVGDFELRAQAVIVTSGGIGGNHDLVRKTWPARLGTPPRTMVAGVPAHVDGRMLGITEAAGARVINPDRMWHYVEGLRNWDPIWENHGIRILPGPSSLWLDATGKRLPAPYFPGFDTLGTLRHLRGTGYDYSWFVLTQKIIEKEFALSGSEQNPDLTGKDIKLLLGAGRQGRARAGRGVQGSTAQDFVVADNLARAGRGMNGVGDTTSPPLVEPSLREVIEARDREIDNAFTKDAQVTAIRGARNYRGDKLIRVATPHKMLDPKAGPLIAVRLNILTRKTLGGLETDLSTAAA